MRIAWTTLGGVVLGASLLTNVWLFIESTSAPPVRAPATPRAEPVAECRCDEVLDRLDGLELTLLALEGQLATPTITPTQRPPSPTPAHTPEEPTAYVPEAATPAAAPEPWMPGVDDADVRFELLLKDAKEAMDADLQRLSAVSRSLEHPAYVRAVLGRIAAFLGLDEAEREAFVETGVATSEQLSFADEAYATAHKQAYAEADGDWTKAAVPEDAKQRWDGARAAAVARMRSLLEGGDARHDAVDAELDWLIYHLAPSRGSFSWRK